MEFIALALAGLITVLGIHTNNIDKINTIEAEVIKDIRIKEKILQDFKSQEWEDFKNWTIYKYDNSNIEYIEIKENEVINNQVNNKSNTLYSFIYTDYLQDDMEDLADDIEYFKDDMEDLADDMEDLADDIEDFKDNIEFIVNY